MAKCEWWVNLADVEDEFAGRAFASSVDRLRSLAKSGQVLPTEVRDYSVIPLYVPLPAGNDYRVVYGRIAVAFEDGEHRGGRSTWDGDSNAYGLGSIPLGDPIPAPPLPDLPPAKGAQ